MMITVRTARSRTFLSVLAKFITMACIAIEIINTARTAVDIYVVILKLSDRA